ncbi:MAG: hypothetical protein P1U88_03155 [Thalassobaculaceae bacterium]|nr:hypothetical protein [Thalassobaculaceae bacterium]
MAFDIFGDEREDTGSEPQYQTITRLDKVAILVGLLDATIDHERNKDTPFEAPEWLVKHYPHVHPNDLDHVLDAGRHALTRLVG